MPVKNMQYRLLFWLFVGLIGAIMESMLLAEFFNRPIQKFAHSARKVSQGDFTEHVQIHSKDELGDLANVFNNMIDQLLVYDEINVNKLITEQNKIEAIIRNIADAVIATDNSNRILFVNEQLEKWFGVKNDEVMEHELTKYFDNENLIKLISKTYEEKQPLSKEIAIDVPLFLSPENKGKKVVKTTSALVIDGKKNLIGVVTTLRDITREKEIDKMKSELISVVSHELRTPLTSIQGFTQLIMEMGDDLSDNIKEFLNIIGSESDRLLNIINDFLDLSRIESGRIKIEKVKFDVNNIINSAIFAVSGQAAQKEIDLTATHYEGEAFVYADKNLINQILVNIVGNAVKYSPKKSKVTIYIEEETDKYWICIRDTGYGIPKEHLDRIFEKFYRVRTGETETISGTGLGLSIVKEIIDKHNEQIFVESEIGKGSTFRFSLSKYKEIAENEGQSKQ